MSKNAQPEREKFDWDEFYLLSTAWHYRIMNGDLWNKGVYEQYWAWKTKVDAHMKEITERGQEGQEGE